MSAVQASRSASNPASLLALLALSFGCMRCSTDAGDVAPNPSVGTPSSAGALAGTAGHSSAAAPPVQGGAGGANDAGASQAGSSEDNGGQGGAGQEPAAPIPEFNGCSSADYVDRSATGAERIIGIATEGLTFTPPCLIIAVGQTVRWQGSLGSHPLAPGNPDHADAGSADSPIRPTSSGQSVEFTFHAAGTFPYYCELHAFGDGQGMAGVVHVEP